MTQLTLTSADGTPLHAIWWQPAAGAKAVIVHVHGLGEHSGRHFHVAEAMGHAGYAMLTLDLRGHGRSGGARGHTPFGRALDDLDAAVAAAQSRAPGLPLFLYGHSMGGLVTLTYVLRRTPEVAGVVVSAAGLRSPVLEQTLKINAAKVLGRALPTVALPTGLDELGLSRDPEVIRRYREDPYVHDQASLALARDGAAAASWALAHARDFRTPLLMVHGSDDPVAYVHGTQEFASGVSGEVTVHVYEGLLHEPHNEPEQDQVLGDIIEWLDEHVEAAP